MQGEINARILRNVRRVQGLTLRADHSYTIIKGLIRIVNGHYVNSGDRGVHSTEILAKLHLVGDHQVYLGYTYLRAMDSVDGEMRNVPNHWITGGAVLTVIKRHLAINTNIIVTGAYEDQNRYIRSERRPGSSAARSPLRRTWSGTACRPRPTGSSGSASYGLWKDRLWFDQRLQPPQPAYFVPDTLYDWTARLEQQPNPADALSFFVSANLQY